MKKILQITALLFLSAYTYCLDNKGYEIKVTISDINDSTVILAYHFGDRQYLTDTLKLDAEWYGVFAEKEKLPDEGERGLAVYLNDDLSQKVHSINPTVEEWNGELWGVTEVQTHGSLSAPELVELTEWLSSQFSDGWGEGLEQREIKIDDGELYLSFWDSSDRFFI